MGISVRNSKKWDKQTGEKALERNLSTMRLRDFKAGKELTFLWQQQ
jgi:hypothetical protein